MPSLSLWGRGLTIVYGAYTYTYFSFAASFLILRIAQMGFNQLYVSVFLQLLFKSLIGTGRHMNLSVFHSVLLNVRLAFCYRLYASLYLPPSLSLCPSLCVVSIVKSSSSYMTFYEMPFFCLLHFMLLALQVYCLSTSF